ncbi:DUF6624 domain-containing protein [Robertkochia aurantiaca]|uniref:DUF6624 domain-containing protein n=1 Tax=Robertkochia aurantiaca TaxID=2873700 RepID=UPI001CCEAAF7|nr:DUF6624 domain-containing protein [Robertkochia sp. 3YJGBD-33]
MTSILYALKNHFIILLAVSFCLQVKAQQIQYQQIAAELLKMEKTDQLAAINAHPPAAYSHFTQEQWEVFKDSIYRTHQKRVEQIFDQIGFPGFKQVGKEGEQAFWLMVQHSDHDPFFQKEVLKAMKAEVAGQNADAKHYAYLTDRVMLNTGGKQVYGTQVRYRRDRCQAYPKPLKDSIQVNRRRAGIGLEPLESYLNIMTEMHFTMNKEFFSEKGIKKPTYYKVPED